MTIIASNSITVSNVNDGTITHVAYAYSADGTDRFTTVYPNLNLLEGSNSNDKSWLLSSNGEYTAQHVPFNGGYKYNFTYTRAATYWAVYMFSGLQKDKFKPDTDYVLSFMANVSTDIKPNILFANPPAQHNFVNQLNNPTILSSNGDQKVVIQLRTSSSIPSESDQQLYIGGFVNKVGTFSIWDLKIDPGSTATPYMRSASEVTTADWPKYIGHYTDFTQADSTNPSDYTWGPMRGDDGKPGLDGHDGIAGKDGNGIKTTVITYAISTNETTAPATGWTSSVPSLVKGQYLWTKTVWTYTDNSSETGYSVTYISKDGNNGNDGIAGKDGNGIKTTVITYASHTNGTTAPTTGYTTTVPSVPAGQFLWTKTVWTYTDNSFEIGYSVAMMGLKGERGKQIFKSNYESVPHNTSLYWSDLSPAPSIDNPPKIGDTVITPSGNILQIDTVKIGGGGGGGTFGVGDVLGNIQGPSGRDGIAGKDGKGIKATAITYQASTNGTTAPTGTWSTSVPPVPKGSFLWTRTIWTYTDNATETGYAVAYMGTNGNNGNDGIAGKDGVGIKTTTITYAGSTSGTTVPNTGWTSTVPTVPTGNYLWTKTAWAYTDNTIETGYSVGKMGNTGPAGPAGSDGNPGKIVSDTEPTTKFKGLAWKYSGVVDMTLGNGTKILAGTEYYWNGTAWALYEINAHNINGDNLSVTNGTFKDGKIESVWGSNGVNGTTTIEGSHLQIHSSDSTTNTENTVAIDNRQGYAQVYTDHNTGRAITVQTSFQGFFVSDSTGPYVRVTPNGIKTSSDKSYNSFQIGAGITINLERRGDIVEATLSGSINSPLSSNTKFVVGTIPVGYRPNRLAYIMVHMTSTNNSSHIDVEPNGLCTWWGTSYNAGAPRGNQMWFTDDPLQN